MNPHPQTTAWPNWDTLHDATTQNYWEFLVQSPTWIWIMAIAAGIALLGGLLYATTDIDERVTGGTALGSGATLLSIALVSVATWAISPLDADERGVVAELVAEPLHDAGWTLLPAEYMSFDTDSVRTLQVVALNADGDASDCTLTWPKPLDTTGLPADAPTPNNNPVINCEPRTAEVKSNNGFLGLF